MKVRSQRNTARQRLVRITVIALAVLVVGMLLPRAFSLLSAVVVHPVHVVHVWLEESDSFIPSLFRERHELQAEIETLRQELVISQRSDLTQRRLWEENNRLRGLLGTDAEERVLAAVIARPDELPYDLLQIDRGYEHGVAVGAPVFIGRDVVIGLVVHTGPDYSFVELATTPGFEATAFISGPNVVVTMEGVGGGVARVRVPQGIPLRVGNLVYLPSVEPGVFGRISHIENRPTQPEQYGYISPEIAISSLYQVAVGVQSQIARSATEVDAAVLEIMERLLLVTDVTVGTTTATTSSITAIQTP
ncbi:hypothetical protein KC906_02135 [Candidatus Kaiserbacteria bacterium]|nr:hypothetical protein [Candidatus Kaiserbacteria bacterium]